MSNFIRKHSEVYMLGLRNSISCFVKDKLNTNNMEQNGSPALSPLQANEEGIDGSGSQFQGTNDDVEEDDPFLKRRYIFSVVIIICLLLSHNLYW